MISRQKTYLMVSMFLLFFALMIYSFNSWIIPRKIKNAENALEAKINEERIEVFCSSDKNIKAGTYINKLNYSDYLTKSNIISENMIDSISIIEINEGFYLNRDILKNKIIVCSDITNYISNIGNDLYEIKVNNYFCGEITLGEKVDLFYVLGNKIIVFAMDKQVKGLNEIKKNSSNADELATIFVDLTKSEYEEYISLQGVYIRKSGDDHES